MIITKIRKIDSKSKASLWVPLLLLFTVCLMPIYYIFIKNIGEIRFIEAIILVVMAYAISLVLFGIICLFLKNRFVSGLIASLCMFLFMNFGIIYNFIYKNIVHSHANLISYLASLLIAIFLSCILIIFSLKFFWLPKRITEFLLVASTCIVLINTVFSIPSLIKMANNSKNTDVNYEEDSDYIIQTPSDINKPNIYFFITDEYASFSCIKKYYNYDNTEFHDFLTYNKFNISETSFSYHRETYNCLADIASLHPVEDISTTIALKNQILKEDNLQYQLLKKLGNDIREVSTDELYPFQGKKEKEMVSNIFQSKTATGDSFFQLMVKKTMLGRLSNYLGIASTYSSSKSVTDYFANGTYLENNLPTVYFSYIMSPHAPFKYDEFGNEISKIYMADWGMPEIYLGQFKYTTKLIMSAVEKIIKNDPNCIIILQSDHGVRYHLDGTHPQPFIIEDKDMRSILNVVYFQGKSMEIEGLSAVNTWRLVLNKLGVGIDLLDDSTYAITVD